LEKTFVPVIKEQGKSNPKLLLIDGEPIRDAEGYPFGQLCPLTLIHHCRSIHPGSEWFDE
jgi:hypothetical protein